MKILTEQISLRDLQNLQQVQIVEKTLSQKIERLKEDNLILMSAIADLFEREVE